MTQKTKLRTELVEPNENISFPIGTILTVQIYYERLGLCGIFGKHKKRGRDINILKNEIEIKPLRCWSDLSIYGALIVGFLAQLFISLVRFEHPELKHTSPKFIKISLMNLTVTVEYKKSGGKRHIFSNFNSTSLVILGKNHAIT
jgi:transposase